MVGANLFLVCLFDGVFVGVAIDAQDSVIVFSHFVESEECTVNGGWGSSVGDLSCLPNLYARVESGIVQTVLELDNSKSQWLPPPLGMQLQPLEI